MASASSSPPAGLGDPCTPTVPCDSSSGNLFCHYPDGLCGEGAPGTCQAIPLDCDVYPTTVSAVCGCDGVVQEGGECDANINAVDVARPERCSSGTFACGDVQCKK